LLWSNGIGLKAMKRALLVGLVSGAMAAFAIYFYNPHTYQQQDYTPPPAVHEVALVYQIISLCAMATAWLAPNQGVFKRRRSVVVWGSYWLPYRVIFTVSFQLMLDSQDAGWCTYHAALFVFIDCGANWVTYYVFALDTKFWHGYDIEERTCTDFRSYLERGTGMNASSQEDNIASPFHGAKLNSASAEAMGNVQGFLEMGEIPEMDERLHTDSRHTPSKIMILPAKKSDQRSVFSPSTLSFTSTSLGEGQLVASSSCPLLDFTRLKLLPASILGQGSSARVYEGRWCGRKCAIKVLFTMDICPDDIKRCCAEAALLHRLQECSEHVVGLFGVAVLPPSLCVVLELCSEGSLANVLYNKSTDVPSINLGRASAGSNPRRSSEVESNEFGSFAYSLSWSRKLELAIGASKGIRALVATLPGYSHNDVKSFNFLCDCPFKTMSWGSSEGEEPRRGDLVYVVKLADVEFASLNVTPGHIANSDTPNWTAPEILEGSSAVSTASDVYSLANVLFEIAVRKVPFDGVPGRTIATYIREGRRPIFPESFLAPSAGVTPLIDSYRAASIAAFEASTRARYKALVQRGWSQKASDRPSAGEVVAELEGIRESIQKKSLERGVPSTGEL
jgi:serine/threonine protein kinase